MVVSMSLKQWTTLRNRDHCVTDYDNKKLNSTAAATRRTAATKRTAATRQTAATWRTPASPHWEVSCQEVLTYTAHTPSDAIYASRRLHISCSTFINQLKKSKSWRNSDIKLIIWKVHAWLFASDELAVLLLRTSTDVVSNLVNDSWAKLNVFSRHGHAIHTTCRLD